MEISAFRDTEDHGRNIATLAIRLRLSEDEVSVVYRRTLAQLAATARIHSFLGILATSTTRALLGNRVAARTVH